MLQAFNEEFLAALAAGRDPAGEAQAAGRAAALLRELGAGALEERLFGHPLLFDAAEFEALGRAAGALLRAQEKVVRHLRAKRGDEAVLDLFQLPRRLAPFVRWENLERHDETVARVDIVPAREGYFICEFNVFPGVGCGEGHRAAELYLETLGYPDAGLPQAPLRSLAALYAARARRGGFARVVILDSVGHGGLGYPRQLLLQRYLQEAAPGLAVELCDEKRYPAEWLTPAEGARTLVHRMFTYEEVTDDFAFLEQLWRSGAQIAGFESELRMSKRFLALLCDPAYRPLLDREEVEAAERYLPRSFVLSEAGLASALRDREGLVFKWDAPASYGGSGVLFGAEWPEAELERKLRAGGVEHWICQRALDAETVPMRTPGDATPLDYRMVLGLFSYGETARGMALRGSRASRVVNWSHPTGRLGWAFVVDEGARRALVDHARGALRPYHS
ncbi:MAG: hypothetical protein MUF34_02565 [Polyangiaceae bacterium]|jgi:hypothetical protein|nr:hypothetical protein [Polyangiaceae bacterium]